jgi:hypothetical protein
MGLRNLHICHRFNARTPSVRVFAFAISLNLWLCIFSAWEGYFMRIVFEMVLSIGVIAAFAVVLLTERPTDFTKH